MILNFNEYRKNARTTAIYPNIGNNIEYPTLGLAGECAEVSNVVEDTYLLGWSTSQQQRMKKELGDMYWYLASLCSEFNIDMGLYDGNLEVPTSDVDVEFDSTQTNTAWLALRLSIQVGSLCEVTKKILRDKQGSWSKEDNEKVQGIIARVMCSIQNLCGLFGLDPREVIQANLDKLASRKKRGVLNGNGDDR